MDFHRFFAPFLFFTLATTTPLLNTSPKTTINYRLPSIYTPNLYTINITIPQESFTKTSNKFTGSVEITFDLSEKAKNISLHASHEYITIDTIKLDGIKLEKSAYNVNNETDIVVINFNGVAKKTYSLWIEYTGILSETDMYGFYKSSYLDAEGNTKYLATTQFEPTYARRAFPCFDEPSFKARFTLRITFPKTLTALHNTDVNIEDKTNEDTTTITFKQTPKMSTYLIAFIVSEFTCTDGEHVEGRNSVPYRVCSRAGAEKTRNFAVEVGPKMLRELNEFTGFNYSENLSKMDQVAIPDFAAGAMENWGLVTYRETALLWDENQSSNINKQRVAIVIAHEFTHQWFGNLVTCKWWSETFINEGFAAFFEDYITHKVFPDWEMDKQFLTATMHQVLELDALENSQSLQSEASSPAEVSDKFGTITYNKGASVLRMVEHVMGEENFKNGLQLYLKGLQNSNADPDQLWNYLKQAVDASYSSLPSDFNSVMKNWIVNSGYPLISVSLADDKTIKVSQERFLLSGEDKTSKWYVPISYGTSNSTLFDETRPQIWLTPEDSSKTVAENVDWIVLNAQQTGYFRVNYDETLWQRIISALKSENFGGIPVLNRAQIVDDAFSLARTGKISYSLAFQILDFLKGDVSYFPWYPAFNGFNFLLKKVGSTTTLGQSISKHLLGLMGELYKSVPINNSNETNQIYTLNQVQAATWACKLGDTNCVQQSTEIFKKIKQDSTQKPDKNLKSIVYCNALRYSTDPTDWEFLWNYYQTTDLATEQVTILSALGCTKNTTILKEYLTKTITTGSGIRSQDSLSAFTAVYDANDEGVDVAFEFLTEHQTEITEKYNSMNSLGKLIKGIADRFTTQTQVDKLKAFIETGDLTEAFKVSAKEALETAEANLAWINKYKSDLEAYYAGNTTGRAGGLSFSLFIVAISVLITKLW